MASFPRDLRVAFRGLWKRPGYALVAVTTVALGVGANTAIFSVLNGVLLEPLPLAEPSELVTPSVIAPTGFEISLSIPNFLGWRERNRTLASFGANAARNRTLTGGDRPELITVRLILGDYFETLGVPAARGRWITSDETMPGAAPIAVITHGFWERRLGLDTDPIGRTVVLETQPFTVVGVMPPQFNFPSPSTEVFLPMGFVSEQMCWDQRDCSQGTWAIGRLKAGVSLEMAQADFDRVAREIVELEGEEVAVARLGTLTHAYVGDVATQLWVLMGASGFVMLIACANVASLLLARGEARRREIAVRTALGAGRAILVRQLMIESLVLAAAGGLVGVGLAWAGLQAIVPVIADNVPGIVRDRLGLDVTVLFFTVTLTAGAGLLFGLVPALRGSAADLHDALREGGRGTGTRARQRLRSAIVVAEVALSLVLLVGSGLMIESLGNLRNVDKGFVTDGVLTASIVLPRSKYEDQAAAWRFFDDFRSRVQALPGVQAVSLSNIIPLGGNSWERQIWPEGVPVEPETGQSVLFHMVSPSHFEAIGTPILLGRGFTESDREGSTRVAVIDQSMAERYWPGEDPIGKRVTFESEGTPDDGSRGPIYRTVIGVAKSIRHYELENPSRIQVYVPMLQSGRSWTTSMRLVLKTGGDPARQTEPVRAALATLDPDVPLAEVEPLTGFVDRALSSTRMVGGLLSVFSILASTLASIGIFGVISFTVVQRLREIGVRMALGARAVNVLWMVALKGVGMAAMGVALGLGVAVALTRVLGSLLYQVNPVDLPTYAAVSLLLLAVSGVAAVLPATRATRVDPAIVLREE